MLLVLVFVIPGWLVKDYLILQKPLALTPGLTGEAGCTGFW